MREQPFISLIISTRGRTGALEPLLRSLERQTYDHFEVIIVDQNADDRLVIFLASFDNSLQIRHLRRPLDSGLSLGRNVGMREASGAVVVFPDDDCWYPAEFLAQAVSIMAERGADILAGKAVNDQGKDINGRFEPQRCRIDRSNVWTTGIEWVVFFKSDVFQALGGYDPQIGVGSPTPWQACEGQDIMLRALDRKFVCHYDPALVGHHAELNTTEPDATMCVKGRMYGRGLGYVLRIHRFTILDAAKWIMRPYAKAMLVLATGNTGRFRYYVSVGLGRLEGWSHRVYG